MFAAFKNSMKTKIVDITKYRQIVGCLVYLIATRPDLTFDVFRELHIFAILLYRYLIPLYC